MTPEQMREIIAHPEDHGFVWSYGPLHRTRERNVLVAKSVPLPRFTDIAKFEATFGEGAFLAMANGTSGKVQAQNNLRPAIMKNPELAKDDFAMKERVLNVLLGARAPRVTIIKQETVIEKRLYVASDETEWDDKAAMLAYEVDLKSGAVEAGTGQYPEEMEDEVE